MADFSVNVVNGITGTVSSILDGLGKLLGIGSPVWMEKTLVPDEPVNTVEFDHQFESAVDAFLTVEVDDVLISAASASGTGTDLQHAGPIALPAVLEPGTEHRVVFRLDGEEGSGAAIAISNLDPGYASGGPASLEFGPLPGSLGYGEEFDVSVILNDVDGLAVLSDDTTTVTIDAGAPGSPLRSGGESSVAVDGVASFRGCRSLLPGALSLTVTSDLGLAPATSTSIDVGLAPGSLTTVAEGDEVIAFGRNPGERPLVPGNDQRRVRRMDTRRHLQFRCRAARSGRTPRRRPLRLLPRPGERPSLRGARRRRPNLGVGNPRWDDRRGSSGCG